MQALTRVNPARCFYLFSQYQGPLLERVRQALSARWPDHDFVFIHYDFLWPDEELTLTVYANGQIQEAQTRVTGLFAAIRKNICSVLTEKAFLNFDESCNTVVASLPGWFNRLQNESELSADRLRQLTYFLGPEYARHSYHPHNQEQDGRIFRYHNLHSFDEAMTYLCGLVDYSYESIIFSLRAVDRIQK